MFGGLLGNLGGFGIDPERLSKEEQIAIKAAFASAPKVLLASHIMSGGKLTAKEAYEAASELSSMGMNEFRPIIKKRIAAKEKDEREQKKLLKQWRKTGKRPKNLRPEFYPLGGYSLGDYSSSPTQVLAAGFSPDHLPKVVPIKSVKKSKTGTGE
jgi:hypothetical protein